MGEEMDEDRNELIDDASRLIQQACILILTAVREADPDAPEESKYWLTARVEELRQLCDIMSPSRPGWPFENGSNVVPFVPPRKVG